MEIESSSKLVKIGVITQARTGSNRLPGKILLKAAGKTLLAHHLQRLKSSSWTTIVATTTEPEDRKIVQICQSENVDYYRGSHLDVLDRYYKCAVSFDLDVVIRCTSDCPFVDSQMIEDALAIYLSTQSYQQVYLSNVISRNYPKGADFEIFSIQALTEAYESAVVDMDREHVTPYRYFKI